MLHCTLLHIDGTYMYLCTDIYVPTYVELIVTMFANFQAINCGEYERTVIIMKTLKEYHINYLWHFSSTREEGGGGGGGVVKKFL